MKHVLRWLRRQPRPEPRDGQAEVLAAMIQQQERQREYEARQQEIDATNRRTAALVRILQQRTDHSD